GETLKRVRAHLRARNTTFKNELLSCREYERKERSYRVARKKEVCPTSLRSIRLTGKPALPDSAVQCDVLAAGYRPWRWPKKSLQKCRWRRRHLPAQASGKIKRRAGRLWASSEKRAS